MTATTAVYGIVYATSTDPLCNGADITEQMAESIESALSTLAADIPRLTVVPYTVVATLVDPPTISFTGVTNPPLNVPWDSVVADIDNQADFPTDGDPTIDWTATQNQPGVWLAGFGMADYTTSGTSYTTFEEIDLIRASIVRIAFPFQQAPTTFTGNIVANGLVAVSTASNPAQYTGQVTPQFAGATSDNITGSVSGTFGWLVWLRDFS
jgi:hypothetical protein